MSEPKRRPDGARTRVPPHDLDAEESALGAALISPAAAERLVDELAAKHFYKPAHQHIADAVTALVLAEEPVDVVTVADKLRGVGLLDEVGGTAYLMALHNATPAVSAIGKYCATVAEHSRARRLIYVASEVIAAAYDRDVAAAARKIVELEEITSAASATTGWDFEPLDDTGTTGTATPDLLARSDGQHLAYSGKLLVFQGEPGTGKSMAAAVTTKEIIEAGGSVVVLDFEDAKSTWRERLVAMGTNPKTVAANVGYHRFHDEAPEDYVPKVLRRQPTAVVIDSVGRSVRATTGAGGDPLDDEKAGDWNEWRSRVIDRLLAVGITVILIDHVVKDSEKRGHYARGTGMKLGDGDGVAYLIKTVRPFNRTTDGAFKMIVAKDRPGSLCAVAGDTIAVVKVKPTTRLDPLGDTVTDLRIYVDPPDPASNSQPDTSAGSPPAVGPDFDNKVLLILDKFGELSTRKLRDKLRADLTPELGKVGGRLKVSDKPADDRIEELRSAGTINHRDGPRGADLWSLPPTQQTLPEVAE
jgi:hypothetical protein